MSRAVKKSRSPAPRPSARAAAAPVPVWLLSLILFLATLALYWPATWGDFINFDDPAYLLDNPHVQGGLNLASLKWALLDTRQVAYWSPMVWLSHLAAVSLFGLAPWGHHLVNILLHAVNAALAFLLLLRLTSAPWRSFIVAALFALHPLRVESVAWIAERKDVLSGLFWLLTLWAYAEYVRRLPSSRAKGWYVLALACFVLGLMSKAMVVTLPFVLLLVDHWPLKRTAQALRGDWKSLLVEKIPFFVLSAGFSVLTFITQQRGGAVAAVDHLSIMPRLANATIACWQYLWRTVWPVNLAVFYPRPIAPPMALVIPGMIILVVVSILCFGQRRRFPYLFTGWFWFLGTLVPVIGLVQSGDQAFADRFTYVPCLGLWMVLVWGATSLADRWHVAPVARVASVVAAMGIFSAVTRTQLTYWKDTETLFSHAAAVTRENYLAHHLLSVEYLKQGRLAEALAEARTAISQRPEFADAHQNLGLALFRQGAVPEAISEYQQALRLKPADAGAHNNLGNALVKSGRPAEGMEQYQQAIQLAPDNADARVGLGNVLATQGDLDAAGAQLKQALLLKPGEAAIHKDLGALYVNQHDLAAAVAEFREAIRLQPADAGGYNNLGIALAVSGHEDEAISQFQQALRLAPNDTATRANLDRALAVRAAAGTGNTLPPP